MKKSKQLIFIFLFFIILFSVIKWYNFFHITEHLGCNDKACVIARKAEQAAKIGIRIRDISIPLIPDSSFDGTRGNFGVLIRDILSFIPAITATVGSAITTTAQTAALTADLGSAFIQSIQ